MPSITIRLDKKTDATLRAAQEVTRISRTDLILKAVNRSLKAVIQAEIKKQRKAMDKWLS